MHSAHQRSGDATRRTCRLRKPQTADKLAATSSGTRSEISAIRSNPNRDVIHRWHEAYPALENAETPFENPRRVGSNQHSSSSNLAKTGQRCAKCPTVPVQFCPGLALATATISSPAPQETNPPMSSEVVDRDFRAACGLTTALWGARSAFGCCANAPSFGWESRSAGTRRPSAFATTRVPRKLMSKVFPRS